MRLAKNNQVTLAEAQKLLRDDELKEFHWTLEEYIQHGRESGKVRGAWAKELENASAKFHISRLQALQLQMQQHLEELYGNYTDGLDTAMGDVYKAGYYKTAYTLQSGFHMGFDVAQIPKDQVDAVLSKPWAADGSNFSDRIWKDKDKLQRNLQDILTQGLVRGDSIQKMAKDLAERMNVARSNAARLIATESAYFASRGELDNMKELGVKEYEFVATLDSRTSDICRSMDGKVIPLKDFKPGTTAPPLHCYCRSCTVPHVGTVENFQKMRAARDPKTGKTVRIPDMTYQDWYDVFVAKKKVLDDVIIRKKDYIKRNYQNELAQGIGKDHYDKAHDIIEQSTDEQVKKLWEIYEDQIKVENANAKDGEAYCQGSQIHINIHSVSKGHEGRKPYETLFHECGHAIDHLVGKPLFGKGDNNQFKYTSYFSARYEEGAFVKAIHSDVDALIKDREKKLKPEFLIRIKNKDIQWFKEQGFLADWQGENYLPQKYNRRYCYRYIEKEILNLGWDQAANISDIIGGATKNKCNPGFGHSNSYWDKPALYKKFKLPDPEVNLATEAFAEFTDATLGNPEMLAVMKEYLPEAYKVYRDMVKDLVQKGKENGK